jgi:hypothetical protein
LGCDDQVDSHVYQKFDRCNGSTGSAVVGGTFFMKKSRYSTTP